MSLYLEAQNAGLEMLVRKLQWFLAEAKAERRAI
jgi:hypothetical protein